MDENKRKKMMAVFRVFALILAVVMVIGIVFQSFFL